jgi:sugar phosphate isomerase/epimerase
MVEICSSPLHLDYHDEAAVRKAARLLEERHIETYSFHAPFSKKIDITSLDKKKRRAAAEEISMAAKVAAILQARYFVLHPGPERNFDISDSERIERMNNAASVLDPLCELCASMGIGIAFENMLPHLFCGNATEMVWLLGSVKSAVPGACLDTGHAFLSGNIHDVMYKLSGHLSMVHANDNRGVKDDHLAPGRGNIDWKTLIWELERTGFHGGFIIEMAGDDGRAPEEILDDARRARLHLRRIMRSLALSKPPTVHLNDTTPP